ncbi:MAG: homocysteine S-methyltransferase family protein [Oscillospiraceae bacterium]|nr:homocysteine S-methyltransferase family protein [Oscillospiraceae bacterium]
MIFDSYGKYIFYDGAMGTMLQKFGLKPGDKPDLMNITAPEAVESIHKMYIEAGSDIICTNTFGSNALNLKDTGCTVEQIITAAVKNAKNAANNRNAIKIALDIGPTGQLLEPVGELEFEQAFDLFKEMAIAGERAGADFVAIETMSDIEELKAAMTAVKDNTKLPILATMTFEKSGYTFMGCTPEKFVETAEKIGAAAIGLNCSLEPHQMIDTAKRIAALTKLPLIIKPNAGLPDAVSGDYKTGAEEFAAQMLPYADIGARIIGGCCGTTPEYIKALKAAFIRHCEESK